MSVLVTIEEWVTLGGWALLWFVAAGLAIWQILRGRALAGACLGGAAVLGLGTLAARGLLQALFTTLNEAVGSQAAGAIHGLTFGAIHAAVLLLLLAAAVLQRPPKPTDG